MSLSLGLGLGVTHLRNAAPIEVFDFYADSVGGSDANDGLSPATPKQTLAAVVTLVGSSPNKRIGLKRGSVWRELLQVGISTASVNGTVVGAYGSGDRPVLRADDVIASNAWSKTGGQTNVYETTITVDQRTGVSNHINVWETNAFMRLVADVATCDSTAGSYYVTSHTSTGSITLYINAAGAGKDPASNGQTYEFTKRLAGLILWGDDVRVSSIFTRRNHDDNGSLNIYGKRGVVEDCYIWDGTKHNTIAGDGVLYDRCDLRNAYMAAALGTGNFIVVHDTTGAGIGYTVRDCYLERGTVVSGGAGQTAVYSHATSGSLGAQVVTGTTFKGSFGFAVSGVNIASSLIEDCIGDGVISFTDIPTTGVTRTVRECQHVSTVTSCNFVNNASNFGGAIVIEDCKACLGNALDAVFRSPGNAAVDLTIVDSLVYMQATVARFVYQRKGALTMNGNTFDAAANPLSNINVGHSGDTVTVVSDYNHWVKSAQNFTVNGTTSAGLSAWQAASGQDLNSDSTGASVSACTLP